MNGQKTMDSKDPKTYSIYNIIEEMNKEFSKPLDPNYDYTPIFWGGMYVGTRQDLKDGKIDPTDRNAWS